MPVPAPATLRPWRRAGRCLVGLGIGLIATPVAWAQSAGAYPSRPIRLVAPFPPGGSSDLIARVLAQKMGDGLAQAVLVDNRPGAGSNLGTQIAARAAPDGYTLLIISVTNAINATLFRDPGYYLLRDFAPISRVAIGPTALVLHPSVPAASVAELIRLARAQPGRLNFGSGGNGTPSHISGVMFSHMAKVEITHVPYKGTGQSVNDLLAGNIQLIFASMPVVVQHIKTGRLRALAVTGAQRTPLAPDLPTVAEAGLAGYAFESWWSLVTNAGVPAPVLRRLNAEARRALDSAEVRARFAEMGLESLPGSAVELDAFTRAEIERLGRIVRETRMRAE